MKFHRLRLFLCGLLVLAPTAWGAPRFVLVQIAAFTCPRCQSFDAHEFAAVRNAVRQAGGEYDFAPVPEHGEAGIWGPRMYYAARLIPGEEGPVRKALFEAAEANLKFKNGASVVAWLEQNAPGVYWGRYLQAVTARNIGVRAVGRAAKLYEKFGGGDFPVFIALRDGKASLVARGGSISALTSKVMTWVSNQNS
ncbi:hypothetical protein [Acidihalobacter aeolianus]|uniref:hypothetical protein n=1 Tax=Acidihalobacter aeolianus TaxID=2792603 RepID=UPI0012EA6C4C|nr:hypothetical protein [Acidihalobacter aeolianus]